MTGSVPIPTEPVDITGATERSDLYDRLLAAIVTGELAPGAHLVEAELSEHFGASRAALRETLGRLSLVQMAVVVPRQATLVAPLDRVRVAETADVLGEVFAQAILEVTPNLTDADRDRLKHQLGNSLHSKASTRDHVRLNRMHAELNRLFLTPLGNADFARVERWLSPTILRFNGLHIDEIDIATVQDSQRAMLHAALHGDGVAAANAFRATAAAWPVAATGRHAAAKRTPGAPLIRDRAAEVIRAAILDGTLVPGERLREADLMRWLGVSRTPVRAALMTLAELGIVTLRYHQPARVAELNPREVAEAFHTLGVLRRVAIREALARDRTQVVALIDAAMPVFADASSTNEDRLGAIASLTDGLADLAGNAVLSETVARIAPRVRWYGAQDPAILGVRTADVLTRLREAITAGDLALAETVNDEIYLQAERWRG